MESPPVVFWLYSYINERLLSAYAILQVSHHPAATMLLFVVKFLNFCTKSLRFCLDSESKKLLNFCLMQILYVDGYRFTIFYSLSHLIDVSSPTDSM